MFKVGEYNGQPVGCFALLRVPDTGAVEDAKAVPYMTLHRLTIPLAVQSARALVLSGVVRGHDFRLAALESECDCQGRMEIGFGTIVR